VLSVLGRVMDRCPDCGGRLITGHERGEVACTQCGLVVAEAAVDTGPEWRVFEMEKRIRTMPLRLVVKTDMAVKAGHDARWRKLTKLHKKTLHGFERRLSIIGAELKRIRECVGLPQRAVEEAESLVRKYFNVVGSLPPEVVAVAVLWTAARAAGAPRPLGDLLKCSRADERRVRRAAWRLKEVMKLGRRPIEDYVKTLAARVNLPAPVVKAALDILEKNRRLLVGRNPWIWAAAALWASSKKRGLLKRLAKAAGTTPPSVRGAAKKLRV
jgi:transcription initiation factor TFIIB